MAIGNRKLAMKITSRDNSLLRHARAVRDGKIAESIFVEGLRLCEEALLSGLRIEVVIYSDQIVRKERAFQLIENLEKASTKTAAVSEKLLESISYTKTPQGIVLLAARPPSDEATFIKMQPANPLLLILHGINNPVNVGAICRTAEAAGASGLIATRGTSDPFSPKALRGAMGSAFRLPIWRDADYSRTISYCRERKIRTISADVSASKMFSEINWREPSAMVVGPESTGLSPDEVEATEDSVRIPMHGTVESLNVAVAAGIILYEAARQRGF